MCSKLCANCRFQKCLGIIYKVQNVNVNNVCVQFEKKNLNKEPVV